jgi:hypothetical protein
MRMRANFALALLSTAALACASRGAPDTTPAPADSSPRFDAPEELVLVVDSLGPLPVGGPRAPRYPDNERTAHNEAYIVLAYVIDTTGRAEWRSASFLREGSASFRESVCDYLRRVRYTPLIQDGRARRALVIQAIAFGLEGGRLPPGSVPDPHPVREQVRREGIAASVAAFELLPHCD